MTDQNVLDYPCEYYRKMRRDAPVHFDEGLQAWLVTRYEDVQEAARMTDELSNALGFDAVVRPEWQDEIDEMMWREGYIRLGPHPRSATSISGESPERPRLSAYGETADGPRKQGFATRLKGSTVETDRARSQFPIHGHQPAADRPLPL
ncbi:MAG: hypothetical protein OXI74_09575 [Rhodospirillaceae bacterium]|nr:hypothetical protein [Rhodospirillaceae bacterium]